ncbi:MAG: response regulator [Myxococcaceae bacterium]
MSRLRVLAVDDELQARKRITRLLEAIPDVELAAVCATAEEVLSLIPSVKPDVLLLDISLPGLSGLEARALVPDGDRAPAVIFVTAHAEHAVEAFDLGATDYVLKPVTAVRLAKAIARARAARSESRPATLPRIAVETRQGLVLLDPEEVVCARFDGALVTLLTGDGAFFTNESLKELEQRLPSTFERVDRRHLLNLARVVRLEPQRSGGYVAVTRTGLKVPVSRQVGRMLRQRLG